MKDLPILNKRKLDGTWNVHETDNYIFITIRKQMAFNFDPSTVGVMCFITVQ